MKDPVETSELLAFAPLTPELQQAKANHEKWERDYYSAPKPAAGDPAGPVGASAAPSGASDAHRAETLSDERAHH